MPVYEIENNMPYDEYVKWLYFFNTQPIGWQEDQRALMLMKILGFKGDGSDIFPSLRRIRETEEKRKDKTAGRVMPTGAFLDRIISAKGGDGGFNMDILKG